MNRSRRKSKKDHFYYKEIQRMTDEIRNGPRICPNCKNRLDSKDSGHFAPPSMGEPGMFACEKVN